MPTDLLTKGLNTPTRAAPRSTAKVQPEGIVEAIVAVTGVVDEVDDLVVPGAFAYTLSQRRPKVVDHHSWQNHVGRVLHIEEWLPGDPRLPKRTKDGKPWPEEAGALVATMQYNLRSERGREAFEMVRFYAESNEAEYSIGYKVPEGKGRRRRDGVRVILMVDLFELSHVLFGAAPLSMALSVKSANGVQGDTTTNIAALHQAAAEEIEWDEVAAAAAHAPNVAWDDRENKAADGDKKGTDLVAAGLAVKANDTGRVLMLQRALDDDDPASGTWEFPGGHIDDGEDPLQAAFREWGEETGADLPHGKVAETWDSPNGVYRGFVYVVPTEDTVNINPDHEDRGVLNPDDPDGDNIEVAAWWNIATLPKMPALRKECCDTPWEKLALATTDGDNDGDEDDDAPDFSDGVMVALYPDQDTAKAVASEGDGALTPDDMHVTLAYLGDVEDNVDYDSMASAIAKGVQSNDWRHEGSGPLSGEIGGLGHFPGGDDGTPTYAPVDVPHLGRLRERVIDSLYDAGHGPRVYNNHGYTPHMTLGYDLDDVKPVPPTPVEFDRVYLVVGNRRIPIPLRTPARATLESKSAAQVLTEAKEGGWDRNKGNAENLRRWYVSGADGRIPWGSDGDFMACVSIASEHMSAENARGYCNLRHKEALGFYPPEHKAHPTAPEEKAMSYMQGSYEDRRHRIEEATRDLFTGLRGYDSGDSDGGNVGACCQATFDTEAVVTVYDDGDDDTFLIPYTVDDRGAVELGEPREVTLSVVAHPEGDGDEEESEAEEESESAVQEAIEHMLGARVAETKALIRAAAPGSASELLAGLESKAADDTDNEDDEATPDDEESEEPTEGATDAPVSEEDAMPDTPEAPADDADPYAGMRDDDGLEDGPIEEEQAGADPVTEDPATGSEVPSEVQPADATGPEPAGEGGEGSVTIDPDEHFSTMDELDSVDTDTATDEPAAPDDEEPYQEEPQDPEKAEDETKALVADDGADEWYLRLGPVPEYKRNLSTEKRKNKPTIPGSDTAWPIGDKTDLKAAVQSFGRAAEKDRQKVKSWIKKRARELDAEYMIPDSWD